MVHELKYRETRDVKTDKGLIRTVIHIRFNDECGNGHNTFTVTADVQRKTHVNHWKDCMGGCCHEHILSLCPHFKNLVHLHLSDQNGAPMYAAGNGFHLLWDYSKPMNTRRANAREYLRISGYVLEQLSLVKDKEYFRYMLEEMDVPQGWKEQAEQGIQQLEEMTGLRYDRDTKFERSNFTPLDAVQKDQIRKRIEEGYYTPVTSLTRWTWIR